jgi:hypothetical protein
MRTDGQRNGGRTDGHDEANGRFSQICERAYKPIVYCGIGKTSLFFS